jgi:hypothetical protein
MHEGGRSQKYKDQELAELLLTPDLATCDNQGRFTSPAPSDSRKRKTPSLGRRKKEDAKKAKSRDNRKSNAALDTANPVSTIQDALQSSNNCKSLKRLVYVEYRDGDCACIDLRQRSIKRRRIYQPTAGQSTDPRQ